MLQNFFLPIILGLTTGGFAILAAYLSKKEEKKAAATKSAEETLDEVTQGRLDVKDLMIQFRIDQIADRDKKIADNDVLIAALRADNAAKDQTIAELRRTHG